MSDAQLQFSLRQLDKSKVTKANGINLNPRPAKLQNQCPERRPRRLPTTHFQRPYAVGVRPNSYNPEP